MKKTMIASVAGMAAGAGLTAYLMSSQSAKRNAKKIMNNALDGASKALNKMN